MPCSQDAASVANGTAMGARSEAALLEHTRALQETMAANKDPKFQNSKFLQFLSKMTRGEVVLEDNRVLPFFFYFSLRILIFSPVNMALHEGRAVCRRAAFY